MHDRNQHQRKRDLQELDEPEGRPGALGEPRDDQIGRGADQRAVAAEARAERQRPPQRQQRAVAAERRAPSP